MVSREKDRQTSQYSAVGCGVGEGGCACRPGSPCLHLGWTSEAPEDVASKLGLEGTCVSTGEMEAR